MKEPTYTTEKKGEAVSDRSGFVRRNAIERGFETGIIRARCESRAEAHLHDTGREAGDTAAERAVAGLLHDLAEGELRLLRDLLPGHLAQDGHRRSLEIGGSHPLGHRREEGRARAAANGEGLALHELFGRHLGRRSTRIGTRVARSVVPCHVGGRRITRC